MGRSFFCPTGTTYHDPDRAFAGYTLFTTLGGDTTYLIDMAGRPVHTWQPAAPLRPYYGFLLDSGNLLLRCTTGAEAWHFGGESGAVVELDWDGRELWRYEDPALHHDHARLRNGNTVLLYWEPLAPEFVARVRGGVAGTEVEGGTMLADGLREVTPDGRTVWEWHSRDSLDPAQDVICPLHLRHEWGHCNTVNELPDGNLLLSFRQLDTICIVERPSGRIAWRWGRGEIQHQHEPTPLANGNILLFDNGYHREVGNPRSRIVEVDPRTERVVWQWNADPAVDFFSANISGAQRLPNGNTLVCEGAPGRIFELTPDGAVVWEYLSPYAFPYRVDKRSTSIFRAHRYAADSPQIRNRVPGGS